MWAAALLLWLLAAGAALAAPPAVQVLAQAERRDADGSTRAVTLPDSVQPPTRPAGLVDTEYTLWADLGPAPAPAALYLPGLLAQARIAVNGQVLIDQPIEPQLPRPRGAQRLRLLVLPPALLRPGPNQLRITLRASGPASLSAVWLGPPGVLAEAHARKAFFLVQGPMIVAAIIGCLGLCLLMLHLRRPVEPPFACLGFAGLIWGLHTLWGVWPRPLLPGVLDAIGWTALYSLVVSALACFALRFAGYRWRAAEHALWAASALSPGVLYAAHMLGWGPAAAELWRLGLVLATLAALTAVAASAWRRPSADRLLLLAAGAAAALLGARDWWTVHQGDDNLPLLWAPYAALPFGVLIGWVLIDRFACAAESLEKLNGELEQRVARQNAELVAALAEMRLSRDAAESANRGKSRFLAAAGHDLRQPLHALGLYAQALQRQPLDAAQRALAQGIASAVAGMSRLFDALLDASRIDAGVVVPRPQAFDLAALLRRLAQDFSAEAEDRGLRLALHISPLPAGSWAHGDPLLVECVLRNLVGNALKFTRRGGVLVSARWRGAGPDWPHWCVEVWDTGPGIAPAEQDRVFDEFYQGGPTARGGAAGLGLGLSIVRRLTGLMGLPLRLASVPGRGSRFGIDLPQAPR